MTAPLVAVIGRRMGRHVDKWPHPLATVSPRAYLDAVVRAGGRGVVFDPYGDPSGLLAKKLSEKVAKTVKTETVDVQKQVDDAQKDKK